MRVSGNRQRYLALAALTCFIACFTVYEHAVAQPGQSIIPHLQDRFGLREMQVRGALGALLVYAHDRLPKPQFDELAQRIPNAELHHGTGEVAGNRDRSSR